MWYQLHDDGEQDHAYAEYVRKTMFSRYAAAAFLYVQALTMCSHVYGRAQGGQKVHSLQDFDHQRL